MESLDIDDEDSYDLGIAIKETGELIGMGGLMYQPDTDEWNLGYNLRRDYWGKETMYSADDGNTEVFYFQNATATFSSFTHEPEVVKFYDER